MEWGAVMGAERKKTILLVEDELLIAAAEKTQLEKYGYAVTLAASGEKAVELALTDIGVDLVLMDINLGEGMDGTQAAEAILERRDMPILFLSSHMEPEIVEKTERISSYGYVVKNSYITVLDASIKMAFKLFEAKMAAREKEARISENERYFRSIIQTTVDGFFTADHDAKVLEVNEAYLRMSGYAREEILGMGIADLSTVESSADIAARMSAIRRNGSARFETRYRRKDGSVFDGEMSVTYLDLAGGRFIAFCRDITARKQVHQALLDSEEKFSNLFNNAEVGMFRTRLDGSEMLDLNEKYLAILGGTREETVGRPSVDFWADPAERAKMVESLLARGRVDDLEFRLVRRDGRIITCLTSLKLYRESGTLMGSIIDISGRKRAEQELRESEMLYRSLIENSGNIVFCVDRRGEYRFVNNAFARTFGKPPDYFVGKTFWDVYPKEDADLRQRIVDEVFASGESRNFEIAAPIGGEVLYFSSNANPIRDGEGRISLTLVSGSDITERKRAADRIALLLREKENLLDELRRQGAPGDGNARLDARE